MTRDAKSCCIRKANNFNNGHVNNEVECLLCVSPKKHQLGDRERIKFGRFSRLKGDWQPPARSRTKVLFSAFGSFLDSTRLRKWASNLNLEVFFFTPRCNNFALGILSCSEVLINHINLLSIIRSLTDHQRVLLFVATHCSVFVTGIRPSFYWLCCRLLNSFCINP